jgi:hypothetical protein
MGETKNNFDVDKDAGIFSVIRVKLRAPLGNWIGKTGLERAWVPC